jgi:hypothetical protein
MQESPGNGAFPYGGERRKNEPLQDGGEGFECDAREVGDCRRRTYQASASRLLIKSARTSGRTRKTKNRTTTRRGLSGFFSCSAMDRSPHLRH